MSEPVLARVVTFTANPSIDRTVVLPAPLAPGEVTRALSVTEQAAGKGVNVARVLRLAGCPVTVVAAGIDDAFRDRVEGLLEPGKAAVVVLATKLTEDKFSAGMGEFGGTVLKTSLSDEDEKALAEELA